MANPVLAPSALPHGLADFAAISDSDFAGAFDQAMAAHRAEVAAIADNPRPATFANTVEALEVSGQLLARAAGIFYNLYGADTTDQRSRIAQDLAPTLAEHYSAIVTNPTVFRRIETLYRNRDELGLDEPRLRLLEKQYRTACRSGAALDEPAQRRMREIDTRLSVLTTQFGQLVQDAGNAGAVLFDSEEDLDGLSSSAIASAARAATDAGHPGGFLVTMELSSCPNVLESLTSATSRRRIYHASIDRGSLGSDYDTSDVVIEITRLRAERAALLGYQHHADFVLAEQCAPDVDAVSDLLGRLISAAMAAGGRELTRVSALAAQAGEEVTAADYRYWLQREQTAAEDISEFSHYCELNRVLTNGVFFAAGRLYGLSFAERTDIAAYHPDVRVWEVFDSARRSVGLYLGDFYARPSKRGGAWMNNFVDQSELLNQQPVIVNVLNIVKPSPGEPTLLNLDNLTTLFHEFGHALHGLLSTVRYASQSGTAVPRDFVEFPSQVNEMWALHPDVLRQYAMHYQSGEPISAELASAARAQGTNHSAHGTIEYLAAAALDLAWHRLTPGDVVDDVAQFEASALQQAGVATELIAPRYRSSYFNHVFSGGYSAGYYSYIWSEVLDADTEQWFLANGGLDRHAGQRFADAILSRGNSVDLLAAHRNLLGREPQTEPLLRRLGLADPS